MAPISKFIPFLFLTTLLFSLQINARESQFFSKVTHVNNNNNVKETEVLNNEGPVNKPEQQPTFTTTETGNSYGLYGHESGLNPPSTTTYQPYKTTSEEETSKYSNNNYYNYQKDSFNTNQNEISDTRLMGTSYTNNNNYYNKDAAFGAKQNEFSDTKFTEEEGYNPMENQNDNKKYYYNNNAANDRFYSNNNNAANYDRYTFKNNAANNNYNGDRQGMSDTRFMEGGKYYYDVNSEKYNPTAYGGSSRGVNSENWYNSRGYFGNNNVNSFENKNSMEGYKNQEVFEDEQDDFEP